MDVATFMDPKKLTDEHANTIGLVTQAPASGAFPTSRTSSRSSGTRSRPSRPRVTRFPTTWDELIALSDKIVADGSAPWCISAGGPGTATGWQITDWVEDSGPQDQGPRLLQRVDHPRGDVRGSGHQGRLRQVRWQDLLHAGVRLRWQRRDRPHRHEGGHGSDVRWRSRAHPGAGCRRSRPGTAPTSSRIRVNPAPSKYVVGTDIGLFSFPTIDPAQTYVEGSADTLMVLTDRPEVQAVAEFLATPQASRAGSRRQCHLDQHHDPG